MYAVIHQREVFAISGVLAPQLLFEHLSKLWPNCQPTLGIGCFEPDKRVGAWLRSLPRLNVPREYDFKRECNTYAENEYAGAYYLPATTDYLRDLAHLAGLVSAAQYLCDHLIGFVGEEALFSFHDAFCGDDMLVSPKIPREHVEAFCNAIAVQYKLIRNPMGEAWWSGKLT